MPADGEQLRHRPRRGLIVDEDIRGGDVTVVVEQSGKVNSPHDPAGIGCVDPVQQPVTIGIDGTHSGGEAVQQLRVHVCFPGAVVADGGSLYRLPDEIAVRGIDDVDGITLVIVGSG